MLQVFERPLEPRLSAQYLPQEVGRVIAQEQHKLTAAMLPAALTAQQKQDIEQDIALAYVAGFRAVMLVSAALASSGALIAWLTLSGRSSEEHGASSRERAG